jgi:tRNA-specific 2-thiouridylase
MAKILVAMSGGVDSSVAALMLQEQGHEIEGAYMKNWMAEWDPLGQCPWEKDVADARAVAEKLGIPFRVVNLIEDYRERVVDYLLKGYAEGVTPNPDVYCNREIKFGVFLDLALRAGFEGIGTGHYARIGEGPGGRRCIYEGRDPGKDQSYFLAMLKPPQIERAWFPVGELLKSEVRARAASAGLEARPRYRAPRVAADFVQRGDGTAEIVFATPQRALAPGQICALYEGERMLGGAVFAQIG